MGGKKYGRVSAARRLSGAGDRDYLYLSVGPLCHPWENSLFFPTDDMVVPRMKESIDVKSAVSAGYRLNENTEQVERITRNPEVPIFSAS